MIFYPLQRKLAGVGLRCHCHSAPESRLFFGERLSANYPYPTLTLAALASDLSRSPPSIDRRWTSDSRATKICLDSRIASLCFPSPDKPETRNTEARP